MAVGAKANTFETEKLEKAGIAVTKIGDCKDRASDIENAIKSGYDAANTIAQEKIQIYPKMKAQKWIKREEK